MNELYMIEIGFYIYTFLSMSIKLTRIFKTSGSKFKP